MGPLHSSADAAEHVYTQYQKAHIDYEELFLKVYIAYNSWYREVTATVNDREAIGVLKKRFVIWDDYRQGKTLTSLKPYMERLAEYTQSTPFPSVKLYWNGEVGDRWDWTSLIEFWYQTRCHIVHGVVVRQKYTWLAYETLYIFMGEIIERMQSCISKEDINTLHQLSSLDHKTMSRDERFSKLQRKLYNKYVASPDIWHVDMQRVSETSV